MARTLCFQIYWAKDIIFLITEHEFLGIQVNLDEIFASFKQWRISEGGFLQTRVEVVECRWWDFNPLPPSFPGNKGVALGESPLETC